MKDPITVRSEALLAMMAGDADDTPRFPDGTILHIFDNYHQAQSMGFAPPKHGPRERIVTVAGDPEGESLRGLNLAEIHDHTRSPWPALFTHMVAWRADRARIKVSRETLSPDQAPKRP